uniref:Uncharacterized protein n=1 Tax=Utricularia reniformis TaxID=192314 RepID=A0A1Y0B020_9LAMI|nr:hypothetical protein AEK19_MT0530 [Utricularia reniformis]ART30786.1 hypothetical protein AEK19_MT0530 [Utricularia reniformis]
MLRYLKPAIRQLTTGTSKVSITTESGTLGSLSSEATHYP